MSLWRSEHFSEAFGETFLVFFASYCLLPGGSNQPASLWGDARWRFFCVDRQNMTCFQPSGWGENNIRVRYVRVCPYYCGKTEVVGWLQENKATPECVRLGSPAHSARRFEFALQKGLEKSNTAIFYRYVFAGANHQAGFSPGALLAGVTQ